MEIEKLILRYLMGETSDEETSLMQEWLKESKENRQVFAQHKKTWLGSRAVAVYDADKLAQDRKTVDLKIRNAELLQHLDKANRRIRRLAYAASIALLVGVSTLWNITQEDTPAQQGTALQEETTTQEGQLFAGCEIEAPYGSKSLVTLPDGTKVWVNAGSRISYPADFGVTSRDVYLTGEAYFDVAKEEDIPFFVNTDVLKIKVYGTAFNVKAYKEDELVETTLDRGAITVVRNDTPGQEVNVEPKQQVTARRDRQSLQVKEVKDTEAVSSWKDNRFVFEQEPLGAIAKQLERRYNVQVHFDNERIKTIRYTAAIKEFPVDQVLEAISLSASISYRIKGTEITLFDNK